MTKPSRLALAAALVLLGAPAATSSAAAAEPAVAQVALLAEQQRGHGKVDVISDVTAGPAGMFGPQRLALLRDRAGETYAHYAIDSGDGFVTLMQADPTAVAAPAAQTLQITDGRLADITRLTGSSSPLTGPGIFGRCSVTAFSPSTFAFPTVGRLVNNTGFTVCNAQQTVVSVQVSIAGATPSVPGATNQVSSSAAVGAAIAVCPPAALPFASVATGEASGADAGYAATPFTSIGC